MVRPEITYKYMLKLEQLYKRIQTQCSKYMYPLMCCALDVNVIFKFNWPCQVSIYLCYAEMFHLALYV